MWVSNDNIVCVKCTCMCNCMLLITQGSSVTTCIYLEKSNRRLWWIRLQGVSKKIHFGVHAYHTACVHVHDVALLQLVQVGVEMHYTALHASRQSRQGHIHSHALYSQKHALACSDS